MLLSEEQETGIVAGLTVNLSLNLFLTLNFKKFPQRLECFGLFLKYKQKISLLLLYLEAKKLSVTAE